MVARHVGLKHEDRLRPVAARRVGRRPTRPAIERVLDHSAVLVPVSDRAGLLVILSVLELPVSWARLTPGADGAVVSRVKSKGPETPLSLPTVCRTSTEFDPSTAVKLELQLVPPSTE